MPRPPRRYEGLDVWCRRFLTPGSLPFIVAKTGLDTAFMSPFYVVAFFAFGNFFIDGHGQAELRHKLASDFWPTVRARARARQGRQRRRPRLRRRVASRMPPSAPAPLPRPARRHRSRR